VLLGVGMKKAVHYRTHADECRMMARRATSAEHRVMLLSMASTWESLALDREAHLARQDRIAKLAELAESR
jgi:hypothetical protein